MPSPADPTAATQNALRRFHRNRRGSAAVEFALVAPIFFALLFATLETAIIFFAGQVLEAGVEFKCEFSKLVLDLRRPSLNAFQNLGQLLCFHGW